MFPQLTQFADLSLLLLHHVTVDLLRDSFYANNR
jgi:hypothetical protein